MQPSTNTPGTPPSATPPATEVGSVFVSNYPPFSVWGNSHLDGIREVLATAAENPPPLGLYLHIPFCRRRCNFCYFKVFTDKNSGQIQRYLDALGREVEILAEQPAVAGRQLDFVYFGGGTPSYIAAKHLRALVERLNAALPWDRAREITFECEPGTLTQSKVEAIREIGATRLSLGVESWNDTLLRDNGRAHLTAEIDRALPWIRAAGFDQLNVDLIAGMVGETWDSWRDSVRRTLDIEPDSVTIYQMELPFNTLYSRQILDGGESPVADWQTKRQWNDWAIEEMLAAGYELSSAYTLLKHRGGNRARFAYRDALWHGADLLGTGVASFSHLAGWHYQNLTGWTPYLESLEAGNLPLGRAFETTADERLTRELILQMKLGRVEARYFQDKFDVDILERYRDPLAGLASRGMLQVTDGAIELSRSGLLQVDSLLPELYDPKYRDIRYT